MPPNGISQEYLTPQDYQITKIDLGKGSDTVDMMFFEASNKKIADRVWKVAQDKQEMKKAMKNMAQYINVILHLEPNPINEM